jgi:replication fork protection complex subunit Tof1/Swi1
VLDKPVQLTAEAEAVLKTFVTSFLDTSFNREVLFYILLTSALFISVTRAMERESSRCVDAHKTQLLYVMAWFLKANLYLQAQGKSVDVDFGNVASVFDPRSLVLVLRIMRDASEHKNWTELHAAIECFEQLVNSHRYMRS